MRLARVIGTVTLVEPHAAIRGGALRLLVPLRLVDLAAGDGPAEALVAWDELAAGDGQLVAFSEGGEAAQPFRPADRPVDAFIAALIDSLDCPALAGASGQPGPAGTTATPGAAGGPGEPTATGTVGQNR